ncbi:MAG: hypothetical protein ACF8Q5_01835 [Phycisphaerales bacterium JB040]
MSGRRGFTLKTFHAKSSTGDGLQIVEHSQWIGKALAISRHELEKHRDRPEFRQTGVYVLHGKNPETGCERLTVGRVSQLDRHEDGLNAKDYWSRIILFTADGPRLHEAHAEFIEARLLQQAGSARFAELDSEGTPSVPPLPEADQADAEYFVEQAVNALQALGVRAFETAPGKRRSSTIVRISKNGAFASGYEVNGRFVVQSGSGVATAEQQGCPGYISSIRESLLARGVLKGDTKGMQFKMDFAFDTPAEAAMVCLADRAGASAWKTGSPSKTEPPREVDESRMPGRSAQGSNAAPTPTVTTKTNEVPVPRKPTPPEQREVQMPASLRSLAGRDSN